MAAGPADRCRVNGDHVRVFAGLGDAPVPVGGRAIAMGADSNFCSSLDLNHEENKNVEDQGHK